LGVFLLALICLSVSACFLGVSKNDLQKPPHKDIFSYAAISNITEIPYIPVNLLDKLAKE